MTGGCMGQEHFASLDGVDAPAPGIGYGKTWSLETPHRGGAARDGDALYLVSWRMRWSDPANHPDCQRKARTLCIERAPVAVRNSAPAPTAISAAAAVHGCSLTVIPRHRSRRLPPQGADAGARGVDTLAMDDDQAGWSQVIVRWVAAAALLASTFLISCDAICGYSCDARCRAASSPGPQPWNFCQRCGVTRAAWQARAAIAP